MPTLSSLDKIQYPVHLSLFFPKLPLLQTFPRLCWISFSPRVAIALKTMKSTGGDSIEFNPGDNPRIYFQNIDGLRNNDDKINLYISSMAHINVGTFCWADPGLPFSNMSVQCNLQKPLHSHFSYARCAYSSSNLPPLKAIRIPATTLEECLWQLLVNGLPEVQAKHLKIHLDLVVGLDSRILENQKNGLL
jgi:hypothetical protein